MNNLRKKLGKFVKLVRGRWVEGMPQRVHKKFKEIKRCLKIT